MNLTVKITKDDIRRGTPSNAECCPLARGLRRALRAAGIRRDIAVMYTDAIVYYPMHKVSFRLPEQAARFIRKFDAGLICDVEPFEFKVTLP
jgi:tRNA A37 threonylcarbamoyladenosine dehydratase